MCVFSSHSFWTSSSLDVLTSRGHTGGRSHRIFHPPSFCGACLNFSREKDSAIPFPRRPSSRVRCHAMHQSRSRMASTVKLTYICSKACSWRDADFCVQECSVPIKSALSFTVVAFREISSTAARMKLLLPIEIHVAVRDLQATRRPTITGLLLQNCAIQVPLQRGVWNSSAAPAGVHRGVAIGF